MPERTSYKARITDTLRVEKVAYSMEICRRINIFKHRTIKFVLKEMYDDGELERSDAERLDGNIKVIFYWLPSTDEYAISTAMELKKHLLLDHLEYSNVQKNFGPKVAIASLKNLAESSLIPLVTSTIEGPISKWRGPNRAWVNSEVAVPHGDIDVIGLESSGNVMWIGEVKMKGDLLKTGQVSHFLATAKRFRQRVFNEKGIHFHLKPFVLAPFASGSARNYCRNDGVELIECNKAYYPEERGERKYGDFYRLYRRVMGFPISKLSSTMTYLLMT